MAFLDVLDLDDAERPGIAQAQAVIRGCEPRVVTDDDAVGEAGVDLLGDKPLAAGEWRVVSGEWRARQEQRCGPAFQLATRPSQL